MSAEPIIYAKTELVEQINAEHAQVTQHLRSGVAHAIRAGELLLDAKRLHGRHGGWEKWLAANVAFSTRTARAYMQLAKLPAEKRQRVADLPLRETLSAIRCREERIERAEIQMNRPAPGPAVLIECERQFPALPLRPPPTADEVADDLVDQLVQVAHEAPCEVRPEDLRAALARRFESDENPITRAWRHATDEQREAFVRECHDDIEMFRFSPSVARRRAKAGADA
jgi:hypothetical protein